tara:strand:- start:281 stop:904 length:624 start_codon:yes stop_codon:yes gene_type:complete
MALSNYTELKASIADFLNRDDLTAVIPDFITLAEAAINRDVRHYEMENRATASLDQQYLDRPADWLETIRINITGGGTRHLEYLSAASMADKRAGAENTTGEPKFFRHAERAFEVFPTPDGAYEVELLYYEKVPALSSTNATNWLLTDHPDVYLYGALLHSSPYLAEDQRIGVWAQLYSAARDRINRSSEDGSFSGSGLTMKIKGLG